MSPRHVADHRVARPTLPPSEPVAPATPQQLAFRLVIELYRASSGRALTHLRIDHIAAAAGIGRAEHRALAIAHAVDLGLLEVVGQDCICLTDEGRRLLR